jgi:WS/DGAT/MGAT family acyltransferase
VRFIDAEDQDRHTSMAIASIAVFEGPPPTYDEFLTALEGRLALVPRYRHKLRTMPWRIGPPVWVDDPAFDLRYHVRRTAVPAPGGDAELRQLMARVMAQRLDRDRPLWEYWFVEGLSEDRWALISKVHHCMVDGVSGTDLYRVLFDLTPEPSPPIADEWEPAGEPSSARLLAGAALDTALIPVREARALGSAVRHPRRLVGQAIDTVRGARRLATALPPASPSSLSGPVGQQRRFTWLRADLEDVKRVKREFGGTVNDVILAAITSGFRALLLARGEEPDPNMLPSLVPVSVRAPGEEGIYENRVSALIAHLPVDVADPVQRLAAIHDQLDELKQSKEADAGETMVALARFVPFPVASFATRLVMRVPQREIVTVTTNVPGPRQPLYGLGRQLIQMIPYVPIATTLRTGIAIISYCQDITIGITGDWDTTGDLEVLARGIETGIAELVAATSPGAVAAVSAAPRAG